MVEPVTDGKKFLADTGDFELFRAAQHPAVSEAALRDYLLTMEQLRDEQRVKWERLRVEAQQAEGTHRMFARRAVLLEGALNARLNDEQRARVAADPDALAQAVRVAVQRERDRISNVMTNLVFDMPMDRQQAAAAFTEAVRQRMELL